jgi:hypothetical protein
VSDALASSMRNPMALAEPGPVTPIFMLLRMQQARSETNIAAISVACMKF